MSSTRGAGVDRFVDARGIRHHYLDHGYLDPGYVDYGGDGPALLLLHGLSANGHIFDAFVADGLRADVRPLALDLRGRGQTDRPTSGYTLDDHAADVLAVLDALGETRVILGGHSYGAMLTYHLAKQAPQRWLGCIVFDPPLSITTEDSIEGIRPSLARLDDTYPDEAAYLSTIRAMPYFQDAAWDARIEAFYRADLRPRPDGTMAAIPDPGDILEVFRGIVDVDCLAGIEDLDLPFLFIRAMGGWGGPGADSLVTPADLARARSVHRDLDAVEVPGNHITFLWGDNAPQVAAATNTFVDRCLRRV